MNNLYGKLCPYCKSEMKQGEDIIICSECNMPHHKECWIENNGCTTFGCLGTIDTPQISDDNDFDLQPEDFDMIRCSYCGKPITINSERCDFCGNRLVYSDRNNRSDHSLDSNQLKPDIDSDYYADIFDKIRMDNSWLIWNWSSFVFSYYWLIYRKMYLLGIAVYTIVIITAFISIPLYVFISVSFHMMLGAFGNYLYYKFLYKNGGYNLNQKNDSNTNITASVCLAVILGLMYLIYA